MKLTAAHNNSHVHTCGKACCDAKQYFLESQEEEEEKTQRQKVKKNRLFNQLR